MIKQRLKGLLALVLAGAAALTTTTSVSAAEQEVTLRWDGNVYLKTDAKSENVYNRFKNRISDIPDNLADIAEKIGTNMNSLNNEFYTTETWSMGWGYFNSGNDTVTFPYNGYDSDACQTYLIYDHAVSSKYYEMVPSPNANAVRTIVFNEAAKTFEVPYYDILGNLTDKTFVFTDGKQELDGTDIFATGGKNKKYTLEYNDNNGTEFSLHFNNVNGYDSAWELITNKWSDDQYSGKKFDPSKLSLHREANFSLNSSSSDVNSEEIKYIKTRLKSTDLWEAKYNGGWKFLTGDQLLEFLEEYNENAHLNICDSGDIYLSDKPLTAGETYYVDEPNKNIDTKSINTLPYDLSTGLTIPKYYELEWNLWSSYGNLGSGWIEPDTQIDSGRKDEFTFDDLDKVIAYPTIEYSIVPIVYSVNTEGGNTLDVTCDNKQFPADGGEYLFTYGDSVSEIVSDKEELWNAIAGVADSYDSSKSMLIKVRQVSDAALRVAEPSLGETPATDVTTSDSSYNVLSTSWSPAADKFAADTEYTVTAVLEPKSGYKFTDSTAATVNGKSAAASLENGRLTVTYTFAKTDKNSIANAVLTVTAPELGKTPENAATADSTYTVTTSWSPAADKFAADTEYTVTAVLEPKSGYKFTDSTAATVNGKSAAASLVNGRLTVTYTFAKTDKNSIANAALTVTAPELGKTPENAATADSTYTVTTSWSPAADKFAADTEYTVTAVLEPKSGYKFTDSTAATVNGKSAAASLVNGRLTVTYAFEKTAKADPWDDIRNSDIDKNPVIRIPEGSTSIPKDIFDKIKDSGKTVTIVYPDGTTWEIDGATIDSGKIPQGGVDLSITKVSQEHWATVVNNVTGHKFRMQIDIAYSGELGFTAYLVLDLSEGMTGLSDGSYYANLYQVLANELKWSSSDVISKTADGKWTAKLKFTHASEWLITIDTESNPRQDSGNSGSTTGGSTGGSYTHRPSTDSESVKARTDKSVGWDKITEEIKSSDIGAVIKITLNDETSIPADAAKAAASRRVKLVIDAGYGRIWNIDGSKLTDSVNLGVSGVNVNIPAEAYKNIKCDGSTQFNASAGQLGFTAQITVPTNKSLAGKNAAVYRYNESSKKLEFVSMAVIGSDGAVTVGITSGGRYFVAYGDGAASPVNTAGTILLGDVNGDGIVNALDASLILKSIVNQQAVATEVGDFNRDGAVNALDASAILKFIVNSAA